MNVKNDPHKYLKGFKQESFGTRNKGDMFYPYLIYSPFLFLKKLLWFNHSSKKSILNFHKIFTLKSQNFQDFEFLMFTKELTNLRQNNVNEPTVDRIRHEVEIGSTWLYIDGSCSVDRINDSLVSPVKRQV